MSPKRSLLSLFGVLAVAITLAGCSLVSSITGTNKPAASASPTSGQCWKATAEQASDWADWEGGPATRCAESHTLYTYAVGKISGDRSNTWATTSTGTTVSTDVQAQSDDACSISKLLPGLSWNQQLVEQYYFLPTKVQWKAGARWVRCDVGLLAFGTTLTGEKLNALPSNISTFVSSVNSNPTRYEFCMNSTESVTDIGPLDNPAATIANCDADPQWTLATHGNLPEASGAPFPTNATANTESTKICGPAATGDGQIWLAYLPTKTAWKSGDRDVDCWVGQEGIGVGKTA